MNYIIHYDVAALLITVTVIIHYYSKKTINIGLTKIFIALMAMAVCSNVLDLVTVYTIEHPRAIPLWLNYMANMVYLISFNCTPAIYFAYVLETTKKDPRKNRLDLVRLYVPITLDILLILTTGFTGAIFSFENRRYYTHGPLMILLYVSAFYYLISALVHTVKYRSGLSRSQRIVVLYYTIGSIVTTVLQMTVSGLLIVQFAVATAVLLIYLSLENWQDFTDKQLGMFNRRAFSEAINTYLRSGKDFEAMGIQVGGIGYIRNVLGLTNINGLLKAVAGFLGSITGRHHRVFYIEQNRFVILADGAGQNWDIFVQVLRKRFNQPFAVENMNFSLDVSLSVLPNKEHQGITQADDVIRMLECSLQEAEESGTDVVMIDGERVLEKGRREGTVLHIIKEALRNGRFEVFYQPIYNVKKKCYSSAEALIRLKDESVGYISPEEFIPIAEQHGLIIEIGAYVFREVCRFITEERLWERGIEYIDVNLSVVQCMQENLHEQLIAIMDEYHLPYHCINLEITETAAVLSTEALRNNMTCLMEKGVNFSLDDYGTGFSNTASIVEYPFHTIKLDKSMLWSSTDSEKAMCALEYMIAMIKSMHMELICEGVETIEQANMLERMGCDYFQGYYYSKPVGGEAFLDLLAIE